MFIIVTMAVILALCGVIAVFVAFPHRGEELPGAPWLGDAMSRAADAVPVAGRGRRRRVLRRPLVTSA